MNFTLSLSICEPGHYLPIAKLAEELGYYAVAVADAPFYPEKTLGKHHASKDGSRFWGAEEPFLDPWVAIPAMVAVTTRLRFWTSVLKLPLRNPILLAKTVASAAVLSDNRVALGVGTGFMPEEYKWTGNNFDVRGELADECIEVVRLVSGGGMVEYHGRHYDFERLQISPAPTQPIPIYVGGGVKAALRRAARLGDGWLPQRPGNEQEFSETLRYVQAHREQAGRSPTPFEIICGAGNPKELDSYKRLAAIGVTGFSVSPWYLYPGTAGSLEGRLGAMRRFADEVMRPLRF